MQIVGAFARRPELMQQARRLKISDDQMNPRSYLSTGNGNEIIDKDRVDISNFILLNRYMAGRSNTKISFFSAGFSRKEYE